MEGENCHRRRFLKEIVVSYSYLHVSVCVRIRIATEDLFKTRPRNIMVALTACTCCCALFLAGCKRPHLSPTCRVLGRYTVRSGTNDAKIIWKIIWKSLRAFCFSIKNAVWVQTMKKISESIWNKPKNEAKSAVKSRMQHEQPNTAQYQNSPVSLVSFMFLLAVLSHNQIIFQVKQMLWHSKN